MDFSSPLLYSDFIQVDSNSVFLSLGYVRERKRERERSQTNIYRYMHNASGKDDNECFHRKRDF